MQRPTDTIFVITGLAACALVGFLPAFETWLSGPQMIPYTHNLVTMLAMRGAEAWAGSAGRTDMAFRLYLSLYFLCMIVFAIAFWLRVHSPAARSAKLNMVLLAAQMLIAIDAAPDLLFIVAAEYALVLPRRQAFIALCLQMAGFVAVVLWNLHNVPGDALLVCSLPNVKPPSRGLMQVLNLGWTSAWQLFAFCVGYVASLEQRNRIRLAGTNAELVATHQLLADAIRSSERVRIARDLHDAIGHHLTALNLHLDLASRQAGTQAAGSLQVSRELAKGLLHEVREAVYVERANQSINLPQALHTLCSGMPSPRIALSCDEDLHITEPALAHAIFRTVQEAISNAARHSGATTMQVCISKDMDGVSVSISDNGIGARGTTNGNGLRGIRERVVELGGRCEIENLAQGGFGLQVWLPSIGGAA